MTAASQFSIHLPPAAIPGGNGLEQRLHFAEIAPLVIESDCDCPESQPITVGLPFPSGSLPDPRGLSLQDAQGLLVPLQTETLARWADGSVKWLLLDFLVPSVRRGAARWSLASQTPASPSRASALLSVREDSRAILVETGVATFHLDPTTLGPFTRVLFDAKDVLKAARVILTDPNGRVGLPRVDQVAVEARGPVRATVRLQGTFAGRVPCRFVARLHFFAGTGLVKLQLTVHNPRRARHAGGLWDLGDPGSMLFRDLSLELELREAGSPKTMWTAAVGQPFRSAGAGLEIYQDSSGGENWASRNHVNRDVRVPCTFRGYRIATEAEQETGLRASPVVSLQNVYGQVSAAIPEFWQQFPKAIEVDGHSLRLRLFPGQFGDLFELQGGEQKTHTVWLNFGIGGPEGLCWVHQPACVRSDPDWYDASRALHHFSTVSSVAANPLEGMLTEVVNGPNNFFARREVIDEYGWRNYGEIYADHEAAYYDGPRPVISHYNNQYDVIYGTLFHYLRTGDSRWLRLADPLARHVIDIDLYHTDEDKAAYNGGLFWFTDHYKDAATSTHRSYSRHNCPPGNHSYGGGPGSNHNFTAGLLHYYYLTGDPQARAAVLSLADWVVNMDDGGKNLLGLIDTGPTGLASATGCLEFQGPGRGTGNSVNALLDAWLLSGRRSYLEKAEELIRRSSHPADDIASLNLLDAEKRWSYTVFLSALARYLDLKVEAGESDYGYAYGRATLAAYAAWMLDHEVPYFDRVEHLEYPTEVWAAQELRKANVLRLASAHVEEPLRSRFLARADELSERGWNDLLRFKTRTVARTLALVMVEGARDHYLRASPVAPAPRPQEYDFGMPAAFVPQKHRILAELRTVAGLARTLLRLAEVRTWRRLFRVAAF